MYAVAAGTTEDVVAAVDFAREHNLRVVVKGGGHSYQGTSSAPELLPIWTRKMNVVTVHDAVSSVLGARGNTEPQQAVTVEAGAIWGHVYDAVTTRAGRYVQGGGCLTVGVAASFGAGFVGVGRAPAKAALTDPAVVRGPTSSSSSASASDSAGHPARHRGSRTSR